MVGGAVGLHGDQPAWPGEVEPGDRTACPGPILILIRRIVRCPFDEADAHQPPRLVRPRWVPGAPHLPLQLLRWQAGVEQQQA